MPYHSIIRLLNAKIIQRYYIKEHFFKCFDYFFINFVARTGELYYLCTTHLSFMKGKKEVLVILIFNR